MGLINVFDQWVFKNLECENAVLKWVLSVFLDIEFFKILAHLFGLGWKFWNVKMLFWSGFGHAFWQLSFLRFWLSQNFLVRLSWGVLKILKCENADLKWVWTCVLTIEFFKVLAHLTELSCKIQKILKCENAVLKWAWICVLTFWKNEDLAQINIVCVGIHITIFWKTTSGLKLKNAIELWVLTYDLSFCVLS